MTAIGFVLMLVGTLGINLFGTGTRRAETVADIAFGLTFVAGVVLASIGVTIQLWDVMP